MNKLFFIIGVFFSINCQILYSQTNELFNEYLSKSFKKIDLSNEFVPYYSNTTFFDDTRKAIAYGQYKYQQFLPETMGYVSTNISIYTNLMYRTHNYIVTIFDYITDDKNVFENNGAYYYFVFYNDTGKIINCYKLLRSTDQQWFKNGVNHASKLFISKDKIMYLLYGPYRVPEMEANCKEVIYEIKDNGSLEKLSERNYKAEKIDQWNW